MSKRSAQERGEQDDDIAAMAKRLRKRRMRRQQLGPLDRQAARKARLEFWAEQDRLAEKVAEVRPAAD